MGALATLDEAALGVTPGSPTSTGLRIRNAGSVVDEFTFEPLGIAAPWIAVHPEVVRLMPGAEEVVEVVVTAPRAHDTPAGDVPWAIKVVSHEDADGDVVEEGHLSVAAFADVSGELVPRTSQGSRRGRHEVAIDNRGNAPVEARLEAVDDDEVLGFELTAAQLLLDPGTAAFTTLDVRPRTRFWRGPNRTHPFRVLVGSDPEQEPLVLDGTMVQRSLLPPWFFKALLALLALLILLWVLWLTLLRPTIESTATAAAEEAATEAAEEAAAGAVEEALEEPLAEQDEKLAEVTDAVNDLAEDAGGDPPLPSEPPDGGGGETVSPAPGVAGPNRDERIEVTDAQGGSPSSDGITIAEGESFRVVDVVLQNPDGNQGEIRLLRDGDQLLVVALQNFRDLDYHFVSPMVFDEGQRLDVQVDCAAASDVEGNACRAAAYVSGTTTTTQP